MTTPYLDTDEIRDRFSKAMSDMYQLEVPQYGTLLKLVDTVNRETLDADPALMARLRDQHELARLRIECHGAIRVGTARELATLRRLFAVMGMFPVGKYLSLFQNVAGPGAQGGVLDQFKAQKRCEQTKRITLEGSVIRRPERGGMHRHASL